MQLVAWMLPFREKRIGDLVFITTLGKYVKELKGSKITESGEDTEILHEDPHISSLRAYHSTGS
jgi:hypothetical protein